MLSAARGIGVLLASSQATEAMGIRTTWKALRDFVRRHRTLVVTLGVLLVLAGGVSAYLVVRENRQEQQAFRLKVPVPNAGAPFALALYQSLGVRMLPGHAVSWLDNGKVFDVLVGEIERARSSVHVVMYIWEKGAASDRVANALIGRAKAGVSCRIVIDAFGSPDFASTVQEPLVQAGCKVLAFRPSPTEDELGRNHRKIVVVDGRVAFTGGFGIRDDWMGDGVHDEGWRDANVRFTGPAVTDAQQAFAENWQEAGGELLGAGEFPGLAGLDGGGAEPQGNARAAFVTSTGSETLTRAERLTQLLVASATRRIWISNAYFVPSEGISELLGQKADQGLDVRVLAPGKKSDSKTAFGAQHVEYGTLQKRGVRVWEYTPSMMHSKTILVDDELVSVGSINLEPLSLTKLDEAALVVSDRDFARQLAATFENDCDHARELPRPRP
jgi:cardiolipin synthase